MTSSRSFRTILLALSVGALGAVGCVLTVGAPDCTRCDAGQEPDPLCHSEYDATNDVCVCDEGYVFESSDPAGNNNFECERSDSKPPTGDCGSDPNNATDANGQCVCVDGWQFCTADPDDFSCCPDGGTGSTDPTNATTESTTGGTDTDVTDTDATDTDTAADSSSGGTGPADLPECTGDLENQTACTNNGGVDGVEGGEAFLCQGGEWTAIDMDAECVFIGDDFAYGCYINDSDEVEYFCGQGPGTDCSNDDDNCSSDTVLQSCLFGKLTNVDCEEFCTGKEAKVQTDFGTCEAKSLTCCCFDEGDEGNCQ